MEGWIFCGYSILLWKWERGNCLAKSEAELALMARATVKLRDEMAKEYGRKDRPVPVAIEDIMIQTASDGRYAGPLIAGRWQVMEGWIRNNYTICDHWREDLLVRAQGPGSDVRRFPTKEAAEAWIKGFTPDMECGIKTPSARLTMLPTGKTNTLETIDMAKNPKAALAEARKAAAEADTKIGAKGKAAPAKVAAKPVAPAKAAPKPAAEKRGPGRSVTTSGTAAAVIRAALLAAKPLSDDKILEKVRAEFGNTANNAVAHYRKLLIASGQLSA
jgi:hypothetical protein